MSKQSLVLFRVEELPAGKKTIKTDERRPRGFRERDTALAFTELRLTEDLVDEGYCEATITHREGMPMQGWWRDTRIHEFVAVFDFRVFYSRNKKLLLVEAPYSLAKSAVTCLNRQSGAGVRLRHVRLDFTAILDKAKKGVVGAWSTNPKGKIRSRAAFGDDLASKEDFRRMSEGGAEFSNLSVHYPFERGTIRVSVSRVGSCFFFGELKFDQRIRFMEHLARFEVKPGGTPRREKPKRVRATA